jgi:hypothetical protein
MKVKGVGIGTHDSIYSDSISSIQLLIYDVHHSAKPKRDFVFRF